MTTRAAGGWCLALMLISFASITVNAAPPTFQITQVYSNLDGSIQFVRLTETAGLNGQQHFAGLTLTSTHDGVVKQYTFPHDLATDQTANLSIVVAASYYGRLPVGAYAGNFNCCYPPAFDSMPIRFLATDGGTIDFAGIDQLSYASLPTDGYNALFRDGTVSQATVPRNGLCLMGVGCSSSEYTIAQTYNFAVEYYNLARDHYFITGSAPDIDALDAGRLPGWQRTGERFFVAPVANSYPGLAEPVCRFYIPPEEGDSHFFSASTEECAQVRQRFPEFVLESQGVFHVALPDLTTGSCPPDLDINGIDFLIPMYRLWNQRADSNHRYTTNPAIRDLMIQRGYVSEGYGPDAVAMCVP